MNKKNETPGATTGRTRPLFRWPVGSTVFFAMCYLAALAAFLGHGAMFYEPFVNAYEQPGAPNNQITGKPAGIAATKKYGQIGHVDMMATSDGHVSNPGPTAVHHAGP